MITRVRKKINTWGRLTYSERLYEFSNILNLPIDNINVINLNDAYTDYKNNFYIRYDRFKSLFHDWYSLGDNFKLNTLIDYYPLIIPLIDAKASIRNNEYILNKNTLVYNISSKNFYKTSGQIFVRRFLILKEENIKDEFQSSLMDRKYFISLNTLEDLMNYIKHIDNIYDHGVFVNYEKTSQYHLFSDNIEMDIYHDKMSSKSLDFDKSYDNYIFDNQMIASSNINIYTNLTNILSHRIFTNVEKISYQVKIKSIIQNIEEIKSTIIKNIATSDNKTDMEILSIINDSLDLLSIFIRLFIELYRRTSINIKTDEKIYDNFKLSELYKNMLKGKKINRYKVIKIYMIYIFNIYYNKDYLLLYNNNIKFDVLFDLIFIIYEEHDKNNKKIEKYKLTVNFIYLFDDIYTSLITEKLTKLFYRNYPSIVNQINDDVKLNVNKLSDSIMDNIIYKKETIDHKQYRPVTSKNINTKSKHKILLFNTEHDVMKYGYIHITNDDIDSLINKLKIYSSYNKFVSLYNILQNIGFLENRYSESETPFKDKIYKIYKRTIWNDIRESWLSSMKSYKDKRFMNKNIIQIFTIYVTNEKKSDEIIKKILEYKKFNDISDISKSSIELAKIKKLETRQERINIYYNLTPQEKLEIDRFTFGTDEWNDQIDMRKEIDMTYVPTTEEDDYMNYDENIYEFKYEDS